MQPFDYQLLLSRLLPEVILVAGAVAILFLDQARGRTAGVRVAIANLVALAALMLAMFAAAASTDYGWHYNGMLVLSSATASVKVLLFLLTAAALLIHSPARFTEHIGEYAALLLFATVGLSLLVCTGELLTAFIALELVSLSLYVLTAFHKHNASSAEAALKYFLFGSAAAAFTLFGISLIFGLAGATNFRAISEALSAAELSPLLVVALVLIAIGFGFKIAAAPLHLWAPDAYQGAPVPSAALIASGSKLASFVFFVSFFAGAVPSQAGSAAFGNAVSGWAVALAVLAAASIVLGNLLALGQSNLRRLIACSAIAHAGYALIALLAPGHHTLSSIVYYLFTYGLAVIGIFGVIGMVEREHGTLSLAGLAGLSRRSPLLAVCLLIFVLSLAGIPPLAGFFGKFYIFLGALEASRTQVAPGLLWIVLLAVAASAVSLYYYLLILKQAFVVEDATATTGQLSASPLSRAIVVALAVAVLLLGCFPNLLLSRLGSGEAAPVPPPPETAEHTDAAAS